jgi:hypothetical protein
MGEPVPSSVQRVVRPSLELMGALVVDTRDRLPDHPCDGLRKHPPKIPGFSLSVAARNKLEFKVVAELRLRKTGHLQGADMHEDSPIW